MDTDRKNVIRHTDLLAAAQQKLVKRKGMRNRVQGALNLLGFVDYRDSEEKTLSIEQVGGAWKILRATVTKGRTF